MPAQWIRDLITNWYPGDVFRPDAGAIDYYEVKHRIAARCAPTGIVEIGVRAGYSAFAFLSAAPTAKFVGIDNGLCDREAEAYYLAHAKHLLSRFPAVQILNLDTQLAKRLDFEMPWEATLVHVDADHSFHGCLHDTMLAIEAGARWILVDDYDVGSEIQAACAAVLRLHPEWRADHIIDGFRGNLLIDTRSHLST